MRRGIRASWAWFGCRTFGKGWAMAQPFCRISSTTAARSRRGAAAETGPAISQGKTQLTIYGLSTAQKALRRNGPEGRHSCNDVRKAPYMARGRRAKKYPFPPAKEGEGILAAYGQLCSWSVSRTPKRAPHVHNSAFVRECQGPAPKKLQRRRQGQRSCPA